MTPTRLTPGVALLGVVLMLAANMAGCSSDDGCKCAAGLECVVNLCVDPADVAGSDASDAATDAGDSTTDPVPDLAGDPDVTPDPDIETDPDISGDPDSGDPAVATDPEVSLDPDITSDPDIETDPDTAADPDADVPIDPCADVACGDHGTCRAGACECEVGYTGDTCGSCLDSFVRDGSACICPAAEQPVDVESTPRCAALPDIAFYDPVTSRWTVYLNNGDGTFGSGDRGYYFRGVRGAPPTPAYGIALADFDGDRLDDLLLWSRPDGPAWSAFRNIGGGDFSATPMFTSTYTVGGLAQQTVGDINGDGLADLLSYNVILDLWSFGRNNGSLSFGADGGGNTTVPFPDLDSDSVRSGDFDGDGYDDGIVYLGGTGYIFRNNTFRVFTAAPWAVISGAPLQVADFNADGLDDFGIYDRATGHVAVVYNRGEGDFDETLVIGSAPAGIEGSYTFGNVAAP